MNPNVSPRLCASEYSRACIALAAIFASLACSGSSATDDGKNPPPGGGSSIATTTIGSLPGDNQSAGFAINTAGHIAGQSADGLTVRAYYWDGAFHNLTPQGAQGVAYAISGGSPEYAGGYQQQPGGARQAIRWTLTSPVVPTILETFDSFVSGLNDAGTAVGRYINASSEAHAAIWPVGSARIDIPPLTGFTNSVAEDIDNDGFVIGIAFGASSTTDKGWVRFTDGTLKELTLPQGGTGSAAFAMSDVGGGQFYVVGNTVDAQGTRTGARWTVQVASRTITVDALPQITVGSGVTSGGDVVGIYSPNIGSAAVLWRNGTYTTLPAVGYAGARGVAAGPTYYIVGDVFVNGSPFATRWTVP